MTPPTAALRRAAGHPLVRLVAIALLQAAATHLGRAPAAPRPGPCERPRPFPFPPRDQPRALLHIGCN
ncbi:hypothetical protein AB0C11_08555 [Streptomyces sp. NPDC039016]|uniref:hypothetical protein n=1 Tax=Streptomyces sp. NPDC039016 TaxID=3154330 RepID=UPI00267A771F